MSNLSNLIEELAKQALNSQNNQANKQQDTKQSSTQDNNSNTGLGGILGSVLHNVIQGNAQNTHNTTNSHNSDVGDTSRAGYHQSTNNQQGNSGTQSGLGDILGSILGQLGTTKAGTSTLLIAVLPLILGWIQKNGGLQGVLSKLQQAGMANQAQSWADPESQRTQTIEPDQVKKLFDQEEVEKVANQTNQSNQSIYLAIASVLPQIIGSLTANAGESDHKKADNDIQNILGSLGNILKR